MNLGNFPGYYHTKNFCEFYTTSIPVPKTPVKICTPVPQYPGHEYNIFIAARNLCEFCTPAPKIPGTTVFSWKTFIPVSGTSVSSVWHSYPYSELVSLVRPCHNTWHFCEFCQTFIPVSATSVSYVVLPYPYSESTNPTCTEMSLESMHMCRSVYTT